MSEEVKIQNSGVTPPKKNLKDNLATLGQVKDVVDGVKNDVASLKEDLVESSIVKSILSDISWETGSYINSSGWKANSDNYGISEPITISAHSTIYLKGQGYTTNVAMIASTKKIQLVPMKSLYHRKHLLRSIHILLTKMPIY